LIILKSLNHVRDGGVPTFKNSKGGKSLVAVKLLAAFDFALRTNASTCLSVIAVTFGTGDRLFEGRGLV
jgi:hypothetical protein